MCIRRKTATGVWGSSCVVGRNSPAQPEKCPEFHEFFAKRHCHGTSLYVWSGLHLHAVYFAFFHVLQLQSPYTRSHQGTQ